MAFPDSPRVIYQRNPLAEVICQLKFPPVLRIDSEPPSGFQERVRAVYPRYADKQQVSLRIPQGVPEDVVKLIESMAPQRAPLNHEFGSSDKNWTATLTRDFVALKTTAYRRWEEFRERIETLVAALTEEYHPAFFTRIGLRYVDVIQRSALELGDVPWSELLNPHIAGEFASTDIAREIEQAARQTLVRLDEKGERVMIRHGLLPAGPKNELCFVIDADFFLESEQETTNAISILDRLNRGAGRLFRWCIEKRLHLALEPQPVGD